MQVILEIKRTGPEYDSKTGLTEEDVFFAEPIFCKRIEINTKKRQYRARKQHCFLCVYCGKTPKLCCFWEYILTGFLAFSPGYLDFGIEYVRALEINRIKIIVNQNFNLADFLQYLQKQEAIKWQK